jgi:GTP cyclohydrolase II
VLVRLHSECFTGDLLASLRCDGSDQLRGAVAAIARAGGGVLLYLVQEGRGIGLVNKLRAYQLQDAGFDTFAANEQPGFDADERVYLPAAEMLRQLGFGMIRLLTNNPEKVAALKRYGIRVAERVPHVFQSNRHNECYLHLKATRSGHFLRGADPWHAVTSANVGAQNSVQRPSARRAHQRQRGRRRRGNPISTSARVRCIWRSCRSGTKPTSGRPPDFFAIGMIPPRRKPPWRKRMPGASRSGGQPCSPRARRSWRGPARS